MRHEQLVDEQLLYGLHSQHLVDPHLAICQRLLRVLLLLVLVLRVPMELLRVLLLDHALQPVELAITVELGHPVLMLVLLLLDHALQPVELAITVELGHPVLMLVPPVLLLLRVLA
jgi:hypothetical protein